MFSMERKFSIFTFVSTAHPCQISRFPPRFEDLRRKTYKHTTLPLKYQQRSRQPRQRSFLTPPSSAFPFSSSLGVLLKELTEMEQCSFGNSTFFRETQFMNAREAIIRVL
jgi:hypothetical protein